GAAEDQRRNPRLAQAEHRADSGNPSGGARGEEGLSHSEAWPASAAPGGRGAGVWATSYGGARMARASRPELLSRSRPATSYSGESDGQAGEVCARGLHDPALRRDGRMVQGRVRGGGCV